MAPSERELSGSPSMLALFARAGAAIVPGASRLPFVAGGGAREIPDLSLALSDLEVDPDRLAAYDRVCGFWLRDELPATYPHTLAFGLHLALMTDGSFPFAAIGLVHISNRITQHRPLRLGEALSLRVSATKLEHHPRGQQFSLLSEARVGDELVWEEVSTNLRRRSSGGSAGGAPGRSAGGSAREKGAGRARDDLPLSAEWRLPGDLGRRYAAVSGDHNPIHFHPLTARLFGFHSAIAHGMWTKARCLAALEGRLPPAYTVEVSFRRPILLPASVAFAQVESSTPGDGDADSQRIRFSVRDAAKGTPHLAGSVSFK